MSWFRCIRQPLNLQQYAMFGKFLESSVNALYWSLVKPSQEVCIHTKQTSH